MIDAKDPAHMIIDNIGQMIAGAAKESQKSISIPLSEVDYLLDSIRYAYCSGVVDGTLDSTTLDKVVPFLKKFEDEHFSSIKKYRGNYLSGKISK